MIRAFVLWAAFATAASASAKQPADASAQTPRAGSNWQHVQALPVGTVIDLNPKSGHGITCRMTSVDAETLACARIAGGSPSPFQRGAIKSVKLSHRTRSTWVGFGIGFAGGDLIGSLASKAEGQDSVDTAGAGGLGIILGSVAGSLIGHHTDFTGSTVYKAP